MLIGFGKFKQRTWESVVDTDHSYMEWCLEKLDVAKFDIPECAIECYLSKFRWDEGSKTLAALWRKRKGEHEKAFAHFHAAEDVSEIRTIVQDDTVDLNVKVQMFELACIDAFGCFPFKRWDSYHAS